MDEHETPRPRAGWYLPAAIAAVLFMALACAMYAMHLTADPAAMPIDERAAYDALPAWVIGAYGVAAIVGLVGAVLLVLKRRIAETALQISLLAILVWLAGLLVIPQLRETMTANDLAIALVVVALFWTIFWFARHSRQRGWLA